MTNIGQNRALLLGNCQTMRKLLVPQSGVLSVLQCIGQLERDAIEQPDAKFGEVIEHYGAVFASLRDFYKVVTPEIHRRYFTGV
jgi:hypothetical protein